MPLYVYKWRNLADNLTIYFEIGVCLNVIEVRFDYMSTSVLMGRVSHLVNFLSRSARAINGCSSKIHINVGLIQNLEQMNGITLP